MAEQKPDIVDDEPRDRAGNLVGMRKRNKFNFQRSRNYQPDSGIAVSPEDLDQAMEDLP